MYPDEEIRQSSFDCTHVLTNALGAAGTFACEYVSRRPGEQMTDVADRLRFVTSDDLDRRIRGQTVPDEVAGVHRLVANLNSAEFSAAAWGEDDQPGAHDADLAVETRVYYLLSASLERVQNDPDNYRILDLLVYLRSEEDGQFQIVDFQKVELPEEFPRR